MLPICENIGHNFFVIFRALNVTVAIRTNIRVIQTTRVMNII